MKPITAIVIGAGNRGAQVYARYALKNPDKIKIVAVAEPDEQRAHKFADEHKIESSNIFPDWQSILEKDQLARAAIIATQDQMHTAPALSCLEKGYDILLEKPMATTPQECIDLVKKAKETGNQLRICHVLRYTEFFSKIYEIINSGKLGDIITIEHRENVCYFHMAHSFVRGNWRRRDESSPMILAKCCHDLDLLYWMVGCLPEKISSFGSLSYFKPENAPDGAPDYCLDGCPAENSCPFYAPNIYVKIKPILHFLRKSGHKSIEWASYLALYHPGVLKALSKVVPVLGKLLEWDEWPSHVLSVDTSNEAKMNALRKVPYGRCVFRCDNDVVDHQVTSIEFENKVTATLTMHGHSHQEGRTIRIDGTKGNLIGSFLSSGDLLTFYDHLDGSEEVIIRNKMTIGAHGGGDDKLMDDFISSLKNSSSSSLTDARASLESHLMAFAADKSRLNNQVIKMSEFHSLV